MILPAGLLGSMLDWWWRQRHQAGSHVIAHQTLCDTCMRSVMTPIREFESEREMLPSSLNLSVARRRCVGRILLDRRYRSQPCHHKVDFRMYYLTYCTSTYSIPSMYLFYRPVCDSHSDSDGCTTRTKSRVKAAVLTIIQRQ